MIRKVIIFSMVLGILVSCQNEDVLNIEDQIESINPENLPSSSQAYLESNFEGEVILDAFKVTDANNQITYEAFMSNNTNLVFNSSNLYGFGNIHSKVEFDSDRLHESMSGGGMNSGAMNGGGMHGNGMMGDGGFRGHPEVIPTEVLPEDLPTAIIDYVTVNYAENVILKAFLVTWEDRIEYHVLVEEVGALLFDADGNFLQMIMRGKAMFTNMEEIAIADLPTAISDYIIVNYPDDEVLRARKVTLEDNSIQIHVSVKEVGVMIFNEDGTFVELLVHRMNGHHG